MDVSGLTVLGIGIKMFSKGISVAFITFLSTFLINRSLSYFNFEVYRTPTFLESTIGIIHFLFITTIIAILIGELFLKLKLRLQERITTIFLYYFFFNHLLRIDDIFFYDPKSALFYEMTFHFFPSLLFAVFVAFLWKPLGKTTSIFLKSKEYFKSRTRTNWIFRFIIGWLSFIPIFYITHRLISPFIEPYYQELGTNEAIFMNFFTLVIIILSLGFVFVTLLIPIFILWERSKTSLLFWIGFPIFIQGGVYTLMVELWLPMGIRFPYLIQHTVVVYIMSILFVQLFYVPDEEEIIEDQFKWMY